jgi:hypothetical protein
MGRIVEMSTSSHSRDTSLRQKELIRGKMLFYLNLIYPQTATLQLLQAEMDYFGYPIPLEELSFHVAYLAEKGLVQVEGARGPYVQRNAHRVKITAHGIDYLDGRVPTDEGVYLEPKVGGR